ncbi:serpin H1-like [Ornithodoros turicata]|uniref:serpin H1-like n=1 Tax=Ornithodoros turicata TaxID=34597 RepID=UPI00313909FF
MTARLCSLCLLFLGASAVGRQPVFTPAARDALYQGALSLTMRISQHEAAPANGSSLFSPLAVALSFAIVLEGAVGATIDDILAALHWDLLRDADVRYVMAHTLVRLSKLSPTLIVEGGVFVQRDFGVNQVYRDDLEKYYGADVVLTNFLDRKSALATINAWTCRMTSRVIVKLVEDVQMEDRFLAAAVLTLVVTMGTAQTEGSIIRTSGHYGFGEFPERGLKMLQVPSGNVSLLLLLPLGRSNVSGLRGAFANQPQLLWELQGQLKDTPVDLTIPRFKVIATYSYKSSLTGHRFLSDRFRTNLATVSKHGRVHLSNMVNAASLEVVGGVPTTDPQTLLQLKSKETLPHQFHAENSLFYFVLDRSENIPLLMGHLN